MPCSRWLREQATASSGASGHGGAVTFVQRFGSSLKANVHFHAVVLEGVFVAGSAAVAPRFVRTGAPTEAEAAEEAAPTGIEVCVQRIPVRGARTS